MDSFNINTVRCRLFSRQNKCYWINQSRGATWIDSFPREQAVFSNRGQVACHMTWADTSGLCGFRVKKQYRFQVYIAPQECYLAVIVLQLWIRKEKNKKSYHTSKYAFNTTRNITEIKDSWGNVLSMNSFNSLHVAPSRMTGPAFALGRCCNELQGKENYIVSVNPNDSMQERNEFLWPGHVAIIAN